MLGSLEVDPEVRIHVQMACLGGTTRGKWQRTKKGGSQAWLKTQRKALESHVNRIPQELLDVSDALKFFPTYCTGLGFLLLGPRVSIQAEAGSFGWWVELTNASKLSVKVKSLSCG